MTVPIEDIVAVQQLLGLYGHVIDNRQWSRLGEIFTDDMVFDPTDVGLPVTTSLKDLHDLWTSPETVHPLGHHVTNVVVTEGPDGTLESISKNVALQMDGSVSSSIYRDRLRRTSDGWRLAQRVLTKRRAETIPDPQ
jgi:hypothetical protein